MKKIIKPGPGLGQEYSKSRRSFLLYTGAGIVSSALLLAGCQDDEMPLITKSIMAPTGLMAKQNDAGEIELSWMDKANNEDGYIVERSESVDGSFTKVANLDAGANSYTDTMDLIAGTTYYYRVAAILGTERSAYSNVVDSMGGAALVNLGSGDVGILNYAYALEQLEAAFYTQVLENSFFSGASDVEKRILEDIQQHEVAHRDFFKAAISTVADPIPGLMVDFSTVDFTSRESVLATAKVFENLGVAAYNGAGKLLESADFLVVAGKIVSVEARHAAVISNLIDPMSTAFTDVVTDGLDRAFMPSEVLAAADPFILTRIDASNLPQA